ncbi:hypothetical protein Sste5346_005167 [Sporothrix stenoceras]|uniref:Mannose-6-phosphate isomerase cupin domain-containing protein n=1 Tax=Sporothrix stenoceras TaxID=5173 RepID=A0ABR3Z4Z1_9PEZI
MPIILPANQPPRRFYHGGERIRAFRGMAEYTVNGDGPLHEPEDWVASTTSCSGGGKCCNGIHPLGQTRLPDSAGPRGRDGGRLLSDAVIADPRYWLGDDHIHTHGIVANLLVKLLDAGQRLPVHAHPHDDWVRANMEGREHYGKAEAWYILTEGEVYLGLKEDASVDTLKGLTLSQDPSLLERLHRLEVKPGDAVYVPPGYLHAVGEGVLIVEVQEPADLSILLEWTGFNLDGLKDGHLGLGWDKALTAVDGKGRSHEEVQHLVVTKAMRAERERTAAGARSSVFPEASEEYFRLEEIELADNNKKELEAGFSLVIVLEGAVKLSTTGEDGQTLSLTKGNTVLLAYGEGAATLEGSGHVLVARPPKSQPRQ